MGPPAPRAAAQLGARLLDVPAAAAYLGLSTWTVRDLIACGKLPRVRIGALRVVRVDREDLDRLVERSKETP